MKRHIYSKRGMGGYVFQNLQCFNWCGEIWQNLTADRQHIVLTGGRDFLNFTEIGWYFHVLCLPIKNAPDRILVLSRTNNLNYPRCHLEFTIKLVRLAGYQHIPDKWRMPSRRRILWISGWKINPFDCALSGPFDNLFLTWFSASQALCKGIIAVISASTVYNLLNCRNSLNCFHFFNDLMLYLAKFV